MHLKDKKNDYFFLKEIFQEVHNGSQGVHEKRISARLRAPNVYHPRLNLQHAPDRIIYTSAKMQLKLGRINCNCLHYV